MNSNDLCNTIVSSWYYELQMLPEKVLIQIYKGFVTLHPLEIPFITYKIIKTTGHIIRPKAADTVSRKARKPLYGSFIFYYFHRNRNLLQVL